MAALVCCLSMEPALCTCAAETENIVQGIHQQLLSHVSGLALRCHHCTDNQQGTRHKHSSIVVCETK